MRRLPRFEYVVPESLAEALAVLRERGEAARALAGGTDILVAMEEKALRPAALVDIKGLAELKGIREGADGSLELGALTRLHEVELSPVIRGKWLAVAEAAGVVGSFQVRNRGTIGGNLCNAAPSADTAPPLIALQARVNIVGPAGHRTLPLENFFTGPGKTVLTGGELLASLTVPAPLARTGCAYLKHGPREAMDIAVVGVAAAITLDDDGICREARIVLGACAPIPLRAGEAESVLAGRRINADLIARSAEAAKGEAKPISDVRSSAEYRREMVAVFTRRAIQAALGRIL